MHPCRFSLLLFFSLLAYFAVAQTSQVEFGKNRVQYHDDFEEWSKYESENFITYWYGEGRAIGQSVVQMAETDYKEIQNILEHRMNDKINIIVYKDLTDLKQSNIGSEEVFLNTGGKTKILGNKIFVYFDGNHNHLRADLREGIASAYLNAMLFGSNLQEFVQNVVLLNLPEWFKDGLVGYAGEPWNIELDDQLRQLSQTEDFDNFQLLADEHPRLVGQSMWFFISQNYGRSVVPNLLYLTRINRSVGSGFLYVLGNSYEQTIELWRAFYKKRYAQDLKNTQYPFGKEIPIRNKRKVPISKVKISPNGKQIAYVLNEIGKVKIYIQDLQTGKRKLVLKFGSRNPFQETDYNYPLLAWNPNQQELSIIYERRDIIYLMQYDLLTGKKVEEPIPNLFHRINSMDYINSVKMVFSATAGGVSDIYIFNPRNRQSQRITWDFWDDLDASFVTIDGHKGILFSSNRLDPFLKKEKLDSILPTSNFDLYLYDLEAEDKSELVRVTHTPFTNERSPIGVDSTWFSYLSDESGIVNQGKGYLETYVAYNNQKIYLQDGSEIILHQDSTLQALDSLLIDSIVIEPVYKRRGITHHVSNVNTNLLQLHNSPTTGKQVILYQNDGLLKASEQITDSLQMTRPYISYFRKNLISEKPFSPFSKPAPPRSNESEQLNSSQIEPSEPQSSMPEPINEGYLFQTEFDDPPTQKPILQIDTTGIKIDIPASPVPSYPSENGATFTQQVHEFKSYRIVPYRLLFRTDYVTTTVDNSLLFGGLNTYAGTGKENTYPPPGILFKANFKDLFEDYVLEGGIRIPTTFNGAEYYLYLDNKKKRLDKRIALYRRARNRSLDIGPPRPTTIFEPRNRETTFLTQVELRYPLDIFRSVRAISTLRFDKQTQLATDLSTLGTATAKQQRLGLRLEYVFDNTLDIDINIKNGTRYKFYGEMLKKFEIDFLDGFNFDLAEGFMTILGLDARHYQRLDRHSILALRAAGATSFGSEKMLFLLGGVDNWMFPKYNNDIPTPSNEEIAYQTFANNLRGFRTNIRNGNSYVLLNAELRVPVLKYFFSRRIRSPFLRSFQIVGFTDVGTAWQGISPFNDDNPLNVVTADNGVVSISVNYFREPIVMGYGLGARGTLFGYFLKFDYAWGIESRTTTDPRLYFSIGKDF